jgi:uncharacterized protein related to proFAR isomerase
MSDNIYKDVIKKYGPISQTLQVAEELVELSKELIKVAKMSAITDSDLNKEVTEEMEENIAEEWADVEVVLNYLPLLFKKTRVEQWKEAIKQEKIIMLANKLKMEDARI